MKRGEAQESLERGHRGPAPVEPERELIQVALEVVVADAVMGSAEPGLEIPKDPMHSREELRRPGRIALDPGGMPVAQVGEGEIPL
jgi:hypothetical protein